MIADALRIEIEAHAHRVRTGNPLFLQAAAGSVSPEVVGCYLVSLRHLVGQTPTCLTRARDRAGAGGRHALAAHFERKRAEEAGHEIWADRDLGVVRRAFGIEPPEGPVPAILELCEDVCRAIDADPRLYLAYVFWAEYFVVLTGGAFVSHLVHRCGVPAGALTCLSKQVALDAAHAEAGPAVIDRLVAEPRTLEPMRRVVRTAAARFDDACVEILALRAPRAVYAAS